MRVVKHSNRLARQVVDSASLKIPKAQVGMALGSLV